MFPDRPVFSSWRASHAEKRMRKNNEKKKKDENLLLSCTAGGTCIPSTWIYTAAFAALYTFRVFPLKRDPFFLLFRDSDKLRGGAKGKPKRTSKFGQVEIISSLGRPTRPDRQKKPSRDVQQRAASSSCKAQSSSSSPRKKIFFFLFQNQVAWKRHQGKKTKDFNLFLKKKKKLSGFVSICKQI